ncbi:MAG: hypothetical protein ACJ8OJ_16985 [Povalibacter sp.]
MLNPLVPSRSSQPIDEIGSRLCLVRYSVPARSFRSSPESTMKRLKLGRNGVAVGTRYDAIMMQLLNG